MNLLEIFKNAQVLIETDMKVKVPMFIKEVREIEGGGEFESIPMFEIEFTNGAIKRVSHLSMIELI